MHMYMYMYVIMAMRTVHNVQVLIETHVKWLSKVNRPTCLTALGPPVGVSPMD